MAINGLNKITGKILSEAQAKADKILADAQAECDRINAEYAERADKIRSEISTEAEKGGMEYVARIRSTAATSKRNLLLQTKSDLIDGVFAKLCGDFHIFFCVNIHNPGIRVNQSSIHGIHICSQQNDHRILRRLLQCLQQRIESALREHMHLVDDIYAVLTNLWWDTHLVNQRTDVFHRVVGRCVQLVDIKRTLFVERYA